MNLKFYTLSSEYCDYLRKFDNKVPINKNEKQNRPFLGTVFDINNKKYFAPLTSPKVKHLKMHNSLDFIRIKDGKYGAINLNNMIPVPIECLEKIDFKILEIDDEETAKWKILLSNQWKWCVTNQNVIKKSAYKLYNMVCKGNIRSKLVSRCCDFKKLEEALDEWNKEKNN